MTVFSGFTQGIAEVALRRSAIYDKINSGVFPVPMKLGLLVRTSVLEAIK
ncbi:AlpA family phage regulatory protein [Marinobacter sp. es.048]